jgi:predicted permease
LENLFVSINVIVPLVLLMGLGYFMKQTNFLSEKIFAGLNKLVFKLLLPCTMFRNIYLSNKEAILNSNILAYSFIFFLAVVVLAFVLVTRLEKDPRKQAVLCQAQFSVNLTIIGIPIILSLFPGQDVGPAIVLFALYIPAGHIFSTLALQTLAQKSTKLSSIVLALIHNPMFVASMLGFIALFSGIKLPRIAENALSSVSGSSMSISLIALGSSFSIPSLKENKWRLIITSTVKLIVLPAAAISIAYHIGFRGIELAAIMILFGSPTSVSSYSVAVMLGGDGELSSQNVLITNILSIVSFFFWIFLLASMNAL